MGGSVSKTTNSQQESHDELEDNSIVWIAFNMTQLHFRLPYEGFNLIPWSIKSDKFPNRLRLI